MFGYVTQKEFDEERERRIKAEERAESWRQLAESVGVQRDQSFTAMKEMRQTHADQVKMLLAHLVPLAPEPPASPLLDPNNSKLQEMTAEEIMAIPAYSKREMHIRAQRAAAAKMRELERAQDDDMKQRHALLTPEEKRATMPDFDPVMGIYVDKPTAEENGKGDRQ